MESKTNRLPWYTNPNHVRKKKNYSWSPQEMKTIYTMRKKKKPIPLIIAKLRIPVTPQHIYNVIRLMKKKEQGVCFQCNTKLNSEEKKQSFLPRCQKCREKNSGIKKKFREKRRKKKLCINCSNPEATVIPGKNSCQKCLSAAYRRRNIKGLCGKCGKNKISKNSIAICNDCLDSNRIFAVNYRLKKKTTSE